MAHIITHIEDEVISADAFTPTTIPQFAPTPVQPVFPVGGLNAEIPEVPALQATQPEIQAQDLTTQLADLNRQLVGETEFRAEQEELAGIPDLQQTQRDLSSRLKSVQAEALAIPLQLQEEARGRGITRGGLAPIQASRQRVNAIQALSTASLLEASRGNITTALDLVDRAVQQEFGTVKEEIVSTINNLNLVLQSPEFSIADKNRATSQLQAQEERAREILVQEENALAIRGLAAEVAGAGGDSNLIRRIQNARTPDEALIIASNAGLFTQGEEVNTDIIKLDDGTTLLVNTDTGETIRNFGGAEIDTTAIEANNKALQEAKGVAEREIPLLGDKITSIDTLIEHDGLDSRVGTTGFARRTFAIKDKFGKGQDFAGGISQLISQETIDTLISLKARGGTLGALSDQERVLLQNAATKIGGWEIRDENGFGTGEWEIDEKSFKSELKEIKRLTQRALDSVKKGLVSQSDINEI